MPTLEDVAAAVESLFEDAGQSILVEGGRTGDWTAALAEHPEALLHVQTQTRGLTTLVLARDLWSRAGDLKMALAATRGLLRLHTARHGSDHPDALTEQGAMGALAQRTGRIEQGAEWLETAWEGLRSVVGGRDIRLAVVGGNLGLHYARVNRFEDAEFCLSTALKIRQSVAPESVATVAGQLAEVQLQLGRVDEALDSLRVAWLGNLDALGERHPRTLHRSLQLAQTLNTAQEFRESVPLWRVLDEVAQTSNHMERRAEVSFHLGVALYHTHKKEEGIRRVAESIRWTRQASAGAPHPELANRLTYQAELEAKHKRGHVAEGLLREAVEIEKRISGESSPQTARRYATLGGLLARIGQLDEAMGLLDGAASLLISTEGHQHPSTQNVVEASLGLIATKVEQLVAMKDKATAGALLGHGLATGGRVLGFNHEAIVTLRKIAQDHRIPI